MWSEDEDEKIWFADIAIELMCQRLLYQNGILKLKKSSQKVLSNTIIIDVFCHPSELS